MAKLIVIYLLALCICATISFPSAENATRIVYPEENIPLSGSTEVLKPMDNPTEKPEAELMPTGEIHNSSLTNKHDVTITEPTTTTSPEVSTKKLKGGAFSVQATSMVVITAFISHLLL